jgi:hypothetical protein
MRQGDDAGDSVAAALFCFFLRLTSHCHCYCSCCACTAAVARFPGIVKEVPFCKHQYGCAFDEIMIEHDRAYVKLDDEYESVAYAHALHCASLRRTLCVCCSIIFIKDGSFEHLAYQLLTNHHYTFYSGNVVNNPHSFAVNYFAGAVPQRLYHFNFTGQRSQLPYFNVSYASMYYW